MLAFDLNHALPAGAASGQSSFQGLVMVDTEGYVVWYHDAGAQVLAFDVFPFTHDVAMNVVLGGSRSSLAVLRIKAPSQSAGYPSSRAGAHALELRRKNAVA